MSPWPDGVLLLGSAVALAALLVLILLYVKLGRISRLRHRKRTPDESSVRSDIRDMMDQLERLAERIDQQAAWRVSELRQLLVQADSTMEKLRSTMGKPKAPADMPENAVEPVPRQSPIAGLQQAEPINHRRSEILRLKSQGLDAIEIARRMEMNVGEVELIMNLHPTQPGTA